MTLEMVSPLISLFELELSKFIKCNPFMKLEHVYLVICVYIQLINVLVMKQLITALVLSSFLAYYTLGQLLSALLKCIYLVIKSNDIHTHASGADRYNVHTFKCKIELRT